METADKSFHKGANDLMAELLMKAKLTFMIVVGGVLQGLGMSLFLFPHDIPTGGAAGIAVLLHYLFQIPHGFSVWAVNVSMLFTALKWLEMRTFTGTLASITVTSVSVLIFDVVFPDITSNLWLDLASGAVFIGTRHRTFIQIQNFERRIRGSCSDDFHLPRRESWNDPAHHELHHFYGYCVYYCLGHRHSSPDMPSHIDKSHRLHL